MVVEILSTYCGSAVGIDIIAPTENACIRDVWWKKIAKPVDIICRPSLLTVSVKSVDSHNTANDAVSVWSNYRQNWLTQQQDQCLPQGLWVHREGFVCYICRTCRWSEVRSLLKWLDFVQQDLGDASLTYILIFSLERVWPSARSHYACLVLWLLTCSTTAWGLT